MGGCAAAALLIVGPTSCGGSKSVDHGCAPVRREALDPGYLVHVLPGATPPRYRTDPPTSGPHQPAPPVTGVVTRPLPRPVQVGLLEAGKVLVQYQHVSAAELSGLRAVAGPRVVLAPALRLDASTRVVATAWTVKLSCSTVDVAAARRFVRQHADHGPS